MDADGAGRGAGLVAAQFAAVAALFLWPGEPLWRLPDPLPAVATTVLVAGVILAVAGGVALGRDLTPFARPRDGAALRTGGPYALSRNPVYAGLLLAGLGHAAGRGRPEPLIAWLVLAVVLHVKTGLEERHLRAVFGPAYADYASRVPRLLGVPRRAG